MTNARGDVGSEGGLIADLSSGLGRRLSGDLDELEAFVAELGARSPSVEGVGGLPGADADDGGGRISVDESSVEHDLAKLVLALIELLRRLLEKQAMRRIEAGTVTDDEIERMGETFLKLDRRMEELKAAFGLQDEDLNLNLGPLGDLM